jgi:tetratricopeptide (TPR) repeat protein
VKKWIITILAAFATLALSITIHWWVPWLLSFATTNKEDIEHLDTLAELASKLVTWPATAILFIIGLWLKKKDADAKHINIQTGAINAQGNASVTADAVAGNKTVSIQGDTVSGDKKTVRDGDLIEGNKYVITQPQPVLPSPHQLPPPPADITGRTAELRELRAAIEKGGIHISGLQGQGGVGKTALALKLAEELSPNYPDAQIYLDLKGVSEKPLTAAEAMSHVLRTFHPEAKLPEKEDDLRALYLSVLHNKRALLLMDNAKDTAQVKPLTPPAGCALLVTSRQHFALPGLQAKNLETLPPPDAKDLLLRIAPRIEGEAEAIAKLCGYLPQALRLAASAIAVRVNLEPRDYARQLADEKRRLELLAGDDESVTASITLSYNLLDAETQKRWRMLAVFPDTFDVPAAAAVWEMETDPAQDTPSRLLQYSMLEWNDSTKRYRLHDLMRDFASQQMTAAESAAAALLHSKHYCDVIWGAEALCMKGGESIMSGLALFDLELENIQTGQAWAAAHAIQDGDAARLCSSYPDGGAYVLSLRQRPRVQIRWREAALAAARQLKDRAAEGRHLGNMGIAYRILGDCRGAIQYYEKDLAIAREIRDRRGEGSTLGNLGNAYYVLGEGHLAAAYHEQNLVIARETGDRQGESNALGNLGNAYSSLGDKLRAVEYYEQQLTIARDIGDRQGEAAALGNLGTAYSSLGQNRRAIEYHQQSLAIKQEIRDRQRHSQLTLECQPYLGQSRRPQKSDRARRGRAQDFRRNRRPQRREGQKATRHLEKRLTSEPDRNT